MGHFTLNQTPPTNRLYDFIVWQISSAKKAKIMQTSGSSPKKGSELLIAKRALFNFSVIILSLLACLVLLTGCESDEMKTAKENLNNEIARIEAQVDTLQEEVSKAEDVAATDETPLNASVIPALESAISEAKTIEFTAPSTPSEVDEINAEIAELQEIDYEPDIQSLKDAEQAVTDSIEQMKLVTNPSEAFVIDRLQGVEGVGDISAVTEDNDPNGQLGKDGGYTATIYFTSPFVDQSSVIGDSVIEKGTDGGGAIEVYANADDANKRRDYLAAFDGSVLASGSHEVIGTVVVRTSNKMTASQQDQLEAAIIEALTRLS